MDNNTSRLKATILSMSLLTVMAGAAVAPALGAVKEHFSDESDLQIKFIVSIPALFIIITNFFFPKICRLVRTRTLALIGLGLYVVSGCGAFLSENITTLLILRAVLGVSVGLIMPLSTGLLAYYFPPEKIAGLMGLSAAMNQMGGVVATLLAGLLATISWNYAFIVYAIGLVAVVLVAIWLPNEKLESKSKFDYQTLKKFHPSVIGMLLSMCIFFIYPTTFAISSGNCPELSGNQNLVTYIMVGSDLVAFLVGLAFGFLMRKNQRKVKYVGPIVFGLGFLLMAYNPSSLTMLLIGSMLVGIANGVSVPYLNTIASIKGGRESATTVMPLLSAALYIGQFVSPIIVTPLSKAIYGDNVSGPYWIAAILSLVFYIQVLMTRNFHRLPPEGK